MTDEKLNKRQQAAGTVSHGGARAARPLARPGVYQEATGGSGRGLAGFVCVLACFTDGKAPESLRSSSVATRTVATSQGALWRPPRTPIRTCAYRQSRGEPAGGGCTRGWARRWPAKAPFTHAGGMRGCEGASVLEPVS